MQTNPPMPTPEQCSKREIIEHAGQRYLACWYPQMGGYVGRCLVELHAPDENDQTPCFEAFVWHDGEFPFGEDKGPPAQIHHCSAEQFIEFGQAVQQAQRNRLSWPPAELTALLAPVRAELDAIERDPAPGMGDDYRLGLSDAAERVRAALNKLTTPPADPSTSQPAPDASSRRRG